MDIFMITGVAIVTAALATLLKTRVPEISLLLSVLLGILVLGIVLNAGIPLFDEIKSLFALTSGQDESVQILFKALGICFVVQIACDACKDLGENAAAGKIEIAGKISVLLISLPLFEKILNVVRGLIG